MSFLRTWIGVAIVAHAAIATANEKTAPPTTPLATVSTPPLAPLPSASAPAPAPPAAPQADTTEATPPEPVDTRLFFDAMLGLGSDQLNLGIGARGGKTFSNRVYLGGLFVYHVGTSTTATVGTTMVTGSASGFYLGPEVGYDIALFPSVVLRPYIGLGLADASASSSTGASASSSELSIWPGVAAHYHLADSKFDLGGDLRIVTGPWGTSLGLFVLGGMHFGS